MLAGRPLVSGSAAVLGVLVTLSAFAVDPVARDAYLTPKAYVLPLMSAGALLLWAVRFRRNPSERLNLTVLELILAVSLTWAVLLNPQWTATREGSWFWQSLAGLVLTFVARQLCNRQAGGTEGTGGTVTPTAPDGPLTGQTQRAASLADLLAALWIVGSALAVHGILEGLAAGAFRLTDGIAKTSVTSVVGHANSFGACMTAGIIAALASAAHARRLTVRLVLLGAALLQLTALLLNGSRGALLGLLAAGLIVFTLRRFVAPRGSPEAPTTDPIRRHYRRRLVVAVLAALVAIVLAGVLLNQINPASGRGRLIAWRISGAMVADRPLTGVGTGRFGVEWGRYQAEIWRDREHSEFARQASARWQPNSELLYRLAERGLPGGVLYVLLWAGALGFLLRTILRREGVPALDWGLLAVLIAIVTHSLVDSVMLWVPTLVTAHLVLGLVPAPSLLRTNLPRPLTRQLSLALALVWTGIVGFRTFREYPGYRLWAEASRSSGAGRLELLRQAERRLPAMSELRYDLGVALLDAGLPEEAVEVLRHGLAVLDGSQSRLALAEAELAIGSLDSARLNARMVEMRYPDLLRPRLLLARIHHAAGREAQARAALTSCIRRETYYRSAPVDSVAAEAATLWRNWYDDEPPR